MPRKKKIYNVAVLDTETDPFFPGRIVKPFCAEFYTPKLPAFVRWGDDCIDQLMSAIYDIEEPQIIFVHNGGKFDFHFMYNYLENPVRIINGRIVKAKFGKHIIQDSYAIIPTALGPYNKMDFDYGKMERNKRQRHKAQILEYLHSDCEYLYDLVSEFVTMFGQQMTVGKTAMGELEKLYEFERINPRADEQFRQFYYGGRVQCFENGLLTGPFKMYDKNSMYPHVMKTVRHPINNRYTRVSTLPDNFDKPFFIDFEGTNKGALPTKTLDGITFDVGKGRFLACSHEIEIGLKHGLIDIKKIHDVWVSDEWITFDKFVDKFYDLRLEMKALKATGDKQATIREIFYKFVLNSAYGKFGQNPENFFDWYIVNYEREDAPTWSEMENGGYELYNRGGDIEFWRKPSRINGTAYYDVAVAASITSAARASLLDALQYSERPIYCDTDSIICEAFHGDVDPNTLGAWKFEGEAAFAAVAGKKLYTLYNKDEKGAPVKIKLASKGGRLSPSQIIEIASGDTVEFTSPVPTFSVKNSPRFVSRKFRKTVANAIETA